jgi:hypothetical protein
LIAAAADVTFGTDTRPRSPQDGVMPDPSKSIDAVLISLGFADNNGVLVAPASSVVTLTPIGQFYELRVTLSDGNAIVAVLSKSAVKIMRAGVTSEVVDIDTLIVPTATRGPW